MSNTYIILALITSGVVTYAIRLFPFLVLRNQTNVSTRMQFISSVLPQAIITILVIYCLKDISFVQAPFGIPELIAVVIVVLLQWWKENTLLSIFVPTVIYMVLLQVM